eukprot:12918610-Prorocentrum_lima.AAC.1
MMRGDYVSGLKRWRAHWPRHQILVFNYEHVVTDSSKAMGLIADFTGIAPLSDQPLPKRNSAWRSV